MSLIRILGLVLIIAGTAGLVWGGFSYTRDSHRASIGPFDFAVQEKEHVAVPTWAGIGAIGVGVVLLLAGGRRR